MPNLFGQRNAQEISLMCENLLSLIPLSPPENGLNATPVERARLAAAAALVSDAIQRQRTAEQAYRQATLDKEEGRGEAILALNAIANTAYATGVAPSTLARYGFAPKRAVPSRPGKPTQVTGLAVTVTGESSARVVFERGENRPSTVFVIESSVDGIEWTIRRSTTRTRETFDDLTPGVGLWFRVTATNAQGSALPSAKAAVYTPSAPAAPTLRVA